MFFTSLVTTKFPLEGDLTIFLYIGPNSYCHGSLLSDLCRSLDYCSETTRTHLTFMNVTSFSI